MKNKYKEALNELRQLSVSKRQNEIYDLLQELVDKETPMKPNGIKCGKCGSWVMEDTRMGTTHFHRCRNIECEQKIDWSNEE